MPSPFYDYVFSQMQIRSHNHNSIMKEEFLSLNNMHQVEYFQASYSQNWVHAFEPRT